MKTVNGLLVIVMCFAVITATFSAGGFAPVETVAGRYNRQIEGVLSETLLEKINSNSDEYVDVFICFSRVPSESIVNARLAGGKPSAVDVMKNHAEITRQPVLNILKNMDVEILNTFWLGNSIYALVHVSELEGIASIPQVSRIYENFELKLHDYEVSNMSSAGGGLQSIEIRRRILPWNLEMINVGDVWDLGYDGSGVITIS